MTTEDRYPREGQYPPAGVVVSTVDSGGHHQDLLYDRGLWWFPDRSMYVYYTPASWRLISEADCVNQSGHA